MATIKVENIYAGIPESLSEELFQAILEVKGVRMERIISPAGQGTPEGQWYDQNADEWVILLQGAAGLRFEGEAQVVRLLPGDYLHIPTHTRHRVEWTAEHEKTVWLAIHYLNE